VARLARQVELCLAERELTLSQYRLLMLLAVQPTVASKLADHLAVSPPSVTAVVDGLVSRHLVERRPQTDDRRRVEHVLTDEGRRLLDEADGAVEARLARIAGRLEPDEAGLASAGLEQWRAGLDADRVARKAEKVLEEVKR
jgi:DNA-binding MarR family transcriptional regulator